MRKFALFLILILTVILLVACDNKSDSNGNVLSQFIKDSKSINLDTIDNLIAENFNILTIEELVSTAVIDNTKVTINAEEVESDVYIWQEERKVYWNLPTSESDDTIITKYLDLAQASIMMDENQASDYKMKSSEFLGIILHECGYEFSFEDINFSKISISELMDFFINKTSELLKTEDGKYIFDEEVLYEKLQKLLQRQISIEQFIEFLRQTNLKFNVNAYYDGERINAYEFVIGATIDGAREEFKVKTSFVHSEEKFVGFKIDISISSHKYSFGIKVVDGNLVVDYMFDAPESKNMIMNFHLSEEKINFTMTKNDLVLYNVDLEYNVKQEEELTQISLSGSIILESKEIVVLNGTEVIIPDDIMASKDNAINILENTSE